MKKYTFQPHYEVEATTEDEAFGLFVEAISRDLQHYRKHGHTQIEYGVAITEGSTLSAAGESDKEPR